MTYITETELWKSLGKDAFTKVRGEVVGTGNGTISTWNLTHDNVILDSLTVYTDGTAVGTASYSIDLDDGDITGLTASADDEVTADYDYADAPSSYVQSVLSSSDSYIDDKTGRSFANNTGSVEYLDVDDGETEFFLKNLPVLALTTVETNTAGSEADTPGWSTSTAGLGNDYLANSRDLEIGRIRYFDNVPFKGKDRLRVTYDHGFTTTPALTKELSILVSQRSMQQSTIYKQIFKGNDNFSPVRLDEIDNRINEIIALLRKANISLA